MVKLPVVLLRLSVIVINAIVLIDFSRIKLDFSKTRDCFRPVLSSVTPGYLYDLVPPEAPVKGEDWKKVMEDVEKIIMPGISHWASPQFHAYFPCGNSYPSIIGDMLSNGIGCIGFSWVRKTTN